MRYAGYMPNDFINGQGVCVSVWTQGCPHRCPGCHNPETWNPLGGYEVPASKTISNILDAIGANGIQRNLSILGGEPLAPYNLEFVSNLIWNTIMQYPNIKIFLWTGYTLEELIERSRCEVDLKLILNNIDFLIDGRFELDKRDITLPLRGSTNQKIHTKENLQKELKGVL